MQTKTVVKRTVDIALTVLLLLLMAFQVTGDTLHEWLGIAMTVLLTVHHILNRKWYGALLKGRYSPCRTVLTAVNTLLLAAIAMTALSGMSMSGHAVPFLYGMIPVMTARKLHLAMSYWSFLLMGVHIGLHLNAMTARPGSKGRTVFAAILAGISGIGLRYILKNGIIRHLLFRTHFAFLDYDTAKWQILLQNLAMLLFFVLTGFALAGITQKSRAHHASAKALIPLCCAVLIGTALHLAGRENASGTAPAHQPAQTAAQTAAQTTLPDRPADPSEVQDGFLLIGGGSFRMGSPDSENWRIEDEQLHTVRVSSFYIDPYEATQSDYEAMTGSNPGTFAGEGLSVHYSGGSTLQDDISEWLAKNGIAGK
ncbi:MAG: SUMF1/EgtB/PvdO family nonheme iron enzyme [Oscillospiraceae bacterium]|nr:SUMF1/EgtB/PvdO family nonheme iron enzyme [Oscillospiraceae bacterium]